MTSQRGASKKTIVITLNLIEVCAVPGMAEQFGALDLVLQSG